MNVDMISHFKTWQKALIVFAIIILVIMIFSNIYSSKVDQEAKVYTPLEDEAEPVEEVFYSFEDLPDPNEAKPKPKPVIAKAPSPAERIERANAKYTIQVASFRNKGKAQKAKEELSEKGYDSEVLAQEVSDKGTWYRVVVGRYTTKEKAAGALNSLRKIYNDCFIKNL